MKDNFNVSYSVTFISFYPLFFFFYLLGGGGGGGLRSARALG